MGWHDDDSSYDSELLRHGSEVREPGTACWGLVSLFIALTAIALFIVSATISNFFCAPFDGGLRPPDAVCVACVSTAYSSLAGAVTAILIGFFAALSCNILGKRCGLAGIVVSYLFLFGAFQLMSIGAPFWDW